MTKKILFIDMDGVLVDFQSGIDRLDQKTKDEYEGRLDEVPHIFSYMKPMEGAIEAYHKLAQVYDTYILSTAPWLNPTALNDKLAWVKKYLGGEDEKNPAYKRLILSHHKDLCHGDYLIDDRPNNGTDRFQGKWLHFGTDKDGKPHEFPTWDSVCSYLL